MLNLEDIPIVFFILFIRIKLLKILLINDRNSG